MTEPLQRFFDAASQLSSGEQEALASWLLSELESEKKWSQLFEQSGDALGALAKEALTEHSRGETQDLDLSIM